MENVSIKNALILKSSSKENVINEFRNLLNMSFDDSEYSCLFKIIDMLKYSTKGIELTFRTIKEGNTETVLYNLYVKKAILYYLALVMQVYTKNEIMHLLISAINFSYKLEEKANPTNGELCILKMINDNNSATLEELNFELSNKSCKHCDLDCKMQMNSKCTMDKYNIAQTLNRLTEKGTITKYVDTYQRVIENYSMN